MNGLFLFLAIAIVGFAVLYKKFGPRTNATIVGPLFLRGNDWMDKIKTFLARKKYPHYVEILGANTVLITHPEGVKAVLKDDTNLFEKESRFPSGTPIGDLFNNGLLGISGDAWKRQRPAISPAMNHDYIRSLVPIFVDKTKLLISILGEKQGDVNMKDWIGRLTLDILGKAGFGYDFDVLRDKQGPPQEAFSSISRAELPVIEAIYPALTKLPSAKKQKRATLGKIIAELNLKLIAGKKKEIAEMVVDRQKDILDALVTSPDLNVRELHSNMWTFFVAGHESTSSSISWALYFLGKYPDIQQKIYDEIVGIIGDRDPTQDDTKNMSYLDMFMKEVMRVRPPISILAPRISTESRDVDGLVTPAGTRIMILAYAIHYLPEFWPEPEKFDPLRFSPENSKGRHSYAYFPFGLGRRHCIGSLFALLEQKIILSLLIRTYKVKYVCEVDARYDIIYTPRSVYVGLERRE